MTITNQTNKVGTVYNSKISPVYIPQKDGGLFGKSKKTFTSLRVTKISNIPKVKDSDADQYKVEVIQHKDAVSSSSVLIGEVKNGKLVLNENADIGNAQNEDVFALTVQAQVKNQKKDIEKQIKNKVSTDSESLFISDELRKKGITEDGVENGLGTKPIDELKQLQKRKDAIDGTRRTKNTYGVMFYPSFIEKSVQDKLKITILEFAPKKERKGLVKKTKEKEPLSLGAGNKYDFAQSQNLGFGFANTQVKEYRDKTVNKTVLAGLPRDQFSFDQRKRMEFEKRSLGHMTLPIPDGVSDANRVDYGSGTLNPLQAGFVDTAAAALMGAENEGVTAELSEALQAVEIESDQVKKIIGAFAAESALKVDKSQLIARTEGQIFNNNLELLFQGPTLRTFNFRYKFSPRDESEIKNVMKIIRAFKQSSAVQRSQSGLFLVTPNTYRLEFKKGGAKLGTSNRHRFLPRIKECALLQCTVDYMPEGSYMTYDSDDLSFQGSMVTYIVTLSFQELDPIFNDDYEDQDLGGIGF